MRTNEEPWIYRGGRGGKLLGFYTVGGVYRKLTCSPWRRSFQHVDAQTSHLVKEVFVFVFVFVFVQVFIFVHWSIFGDDFGTTWALLWQNLARLWHTLAHSGTLWHDFGMTLA